MALPMWLPYHLTMLVLILAGVVYAILTDSLTVAILTAALILYRAQRPSRFGQRVREAWQMRQLVEATAEDVRE